MKSRKTAMIALLVVGMAVIVTAGGLFASNMGFKLNYTLDGLNDNGSEEGKNHMGLPWNRQVGIDKAADLFVDINGEIPITNPTNIRITRIEQYDRTTATFRGYQLNTGAFGPGNYPLDKAESLIVTMNANKGGPYIVVGSHDPGHSIQLDGSGLNGSLEGKNYYGHPYHAVAAQASELFLEIGKADITRIERYDRTTATFQGYQLNSGIAGDYALNAGDGLIITMKSGLGGPFQPAHY